MLKIQSIFPKTYHELRCIFCVMLASMFAMLMTSCSGNMESNSSIAGQTEITKEASISIASGGSIIGIDNGEINCEGDGIVT